MPAVSVVIPTYNRVHLLREAVESVFGQSFTDFETIVVDDGSTDDTRRVVLEYGERIRYFYQTNRGRSAARNSGLARANGRYVLFLDSDDLLLPRSLEVLATFLDSHPRVGVAYSNARLCDVKAHDLGALVIEQPAVTKLGRADFLERLVLNNVVGAIHCAMIRREWLDRVDPFGFDESLEVEEDADLWIRLVVAGCEFQHLNEMTCVYRQHPGNTIGFRSDQQCTRDAYLRSRLKVFYSEFFPRLAPTTQETFLYCLLLDPSFGDRSLSKPLLSSTQFQALPPSVKAKLLYLLAIDDLLWAEDVTLARARLDLASALSSHRWKYKLARAAIEISPWTLAKLVSVARRFLTPKSAKAKGTV